MKRHGFALAFLSSLVGVACGEAPPADVLLDEDVELGTAESALTYRACTTDLQCATSCMCSNNQCVPDGLGPANPDCGAPPQRACTTAADCRDACDCRNGTCRPDAIGPTYWGCHLPPPDAYENDNDAAHATHYMGTPQTGKNFHELGDADWVLVYFGVAGQAKFETYDLRGADTYLQVYKYSNGSAGTLVGANDNICSTWFDWRCRASKLTLNVPANSLYLVRVTNKNEAAHNEYNQEAPGYSLRIYY